MKPSFTSSTPTPPGATALPADDGTDGARVFRFVAGDPATVDEVRRWIRGALTPYRRTLALEIEDIEGEVLLSLTESLRAGRFEGRSSFATYVRRAVLYRSINRLRDRRKRENVPLDEEAFASLEPDPERSASDAERTRLALHVLAGMSEACRELWRRIAAGLDYRAIAERTGVAPGTLRVRALRCRQSAIAAWRSQFGEAR